MAQERRVTFARGPFATEDGHPPHEGLTAQAKEHWYPKINASPEPITSRHITSLAKFLGLPEYQATIDKLKRFVGDLPPLQRPDPAALASQATSPPPTPTMDTPLARGKRKREEAGPGRAATPSDGG